MVLISSLKISYRLLFSFMEAIPSTQRVTLLRNMTYRCSPLQIEMVRFLRRKQVCTVGELLELFPCEDKRDLKTVIKSIIGLSERNIIRFLNN